VLADACDVSIETIRAMEGGRRFHGPGAQRVADYFGVEDVDVLYMNAIVPERLHPRAAAQVRPRPTEPDEPEPEADFTPPITREALGV